MNTTTQARAATVEEELLERVRKLATQSAEKILSYDTLPGNIDFPEDMYAIAAGSELAIGMKAMEEVCKPLSIDAGANILACRNVLVCESENRKTTYRQFDKLNGEFGRRLAYFVLNLEALGLTRAASTPVWEAFDAQVNYRNGIKQTDSEKKADQNGNYFCLVLRKHSRAFFEHLSGKPFSELTGDQRRVGILMTGPKTIEFFWAPRDEAQGVSGGFAAGKTSVHTTNFTAAGIKQTGKQLSSDKREIHPCQIYLGMDYQGNRRVYCTLDVGMNIEMAETHEGGLPRHTIEQGTRKSSDAETPGTEDAPHVEVTASVAAVPPAAPLTTEPIVKKIVDSVDVLRPVDSPISFTYGTHQFIVPTGEAQDRGQPITVIDMNNPLAARPATDFELVVLRDNLQKQSTHADL